MDKKVFTYLSSTVDERSVSAIRNRFPAHITSVASIEELYSLLGNSSFYSDFISIDIGIFLSRKDKLDAFDIIHAISTLIRSTKYQNPKTKELQARSTKIIVLVDEKIEPKIIKEIARIPDVASIGWLAKGVSDVEDVSKHIEQLISGIYTPHPKVIKLLKPPKKKNRENKNEIILTARQKQILQLVRNRGASNKVIAKLLGISESTVKLHMGAVLKKFGVKNRTQLAIFSQDNFTH